MVSKSFRYKTSLYVMATLYVVAGINHFLSPQTYIKIMPPYLPYPFALIYVSGVLESLLGLLLFFKPARNVAAWGVIALLIAVFPANVQMMVNYLHQNNPQLWIAVLRLPLQLLLIWWAYTFTKTGKTAYNLH